MNNALMNMGTQISLRDSDFHYFGEISRSGIAGPYGNFIFNFLRNLHSISVKAILFYIATNNVRGLQFLYILFFPSFLREKLKVPQPPSPCAELGNGVGLSVFD